MVLISISTISNSYALSAEDTKSKVPIEILRRHSSKLQQRVRFRSMVQVRETISIKQYTLEEIHSTWYSKVENSRRKIETQALDCGMPGISGNSLRKRRRSKLCGLMAVLQEQERQRERGIYNPNSIAIAYSYSVQNCCLEAYKIALLAELETWDFKI
jgi:hypothetical protein